MMEQFNMFAFALLAMFPLGAFAAPAMTGFYPSKSQQTSLIPQPTSPPSNGNPALLARDNPAPSLSSIWIITLPVGETTTILDGWHSPIPWTAGAAATTFTTTLGTAEAPWLNGPVTSGSSIYTTAITTDSFAFVYTAVPSTPTIQTAFTEGAQSSVTVTFGSGLSTAYSAQSGLTQTATTIWSYPVVSGTTYTAAWEEFSSVATTSTLSNVATITQGTAPSSVISWGTGAAAQTATITIDTALAAGTTKVLTQAGSVGGVLTTFQVLETVPTGSVTTGVPLAQITVPSGASSVTLTDTMTGTHMEAVPTGITGLVSAIITDASALSETLYYDISGAAVINVQATGGVITVHPGDVISAGGTAVATVPSLAAGASLSSLTWTETFLEVPGGNNLGGQQSALPTFTTIVGPGATVLVGSGSFTLSTTPTTILTLETLTVTNPSTTVTRVLDIIATSEAAIGGGAELGTLTKHIGDYLTVLTGPGPSETTLSLPTSATYVTTASFVINGGGYTALQTFWLDVI